MPMLSQELQGLLPALLFVIENEESVQCLAEQMQLEQQTLPQMLQRVELEPMVRASGALYLYPTRAALEADRDFWRMRGEHGTEHEILEGAALHDFQPGLSPGLYAGIYAPKYRAVTDPGDYCEALHAALAARPVETVYSTIDRLEPLSDGVIVHDREQALARVKHAVLAAGPWSGRLAAELGDRVPLIGERGYNTTFPKSAFEALDKTLFFTADGFVMAPLADGVRVGGASEIAGLERAPDFRRSRIMVQKARKLVPGLRQCEGDEWMGIRPTTPDTLPVIGYSRASRRILYAFGHGHLGLTQATSTAQLVADLVANRPSAFNIDALSAERF